MKTSILTFLVVFSCFSSEHNLECDEIGEALDFPVYRCENDEVVCFQWEEEILCTQIEDNDETDCDCTMPSLQCVQFCERD